MKVLATYKNDNKVQTTSATGNIHNFFRDASPTSLTDTAMLEMFNPTPELVNTNAAR